MPYARQGQGATLGLFTDLYELRMAQTYVAQNMMAPATFTLYIRPTPSRPWFLTAGIENAVDIIERFTYTSRELDYLAAELDLPDDFLSWLADFEPQGELHAVPDGTIVLADEPLLEFTAPLPVAQLLETALMNVVHLPTLVATKAARCVTAADGRSLVDFGARRAHDIEAAVEAARAAWLAGFAGTSNVEAGHRFGIPIVGTMAHAFIQAFVDERDAFRAFGRDHPDNVVLLVDTYDTLDGVQHAIDVGKELRDDGIELGGVRLDSGDLDELARETRRMLDAAGFPDARVMASGGLDEWGIHELLVAGAPIDAFGIGTSLTTSRDQPAVDIAYKLVEYDGVPKAKYSEGKLLLPGAKQVFRDGGPASDVLGRRHEDLPGERLLVPTWRDGELLRPPDLADARDRAAAAIAELPGDWLRPDGPEDTPRPEVSGALRGLADETRERELGSG